MNNWDEVFDSPEFSEEQLSEIGKLNVSLNHKRFGKKGDLTWDIFSGNELAASYSYTARDVDGDWGPARSYMRRLSFSKLLEIIKNPLKHFDTRSWN